MRYLRELLIYLLLFFMLFACSSNELVKRSEFKGDLAELRADLLKQQKKFALNKIAKAKLLKKEKEAQKKAIKKKEKQEKTGEKEKTEEKKEKKDSTEKLNAKEVVVKEKDVAGEKKDKEDKKDKKENREKENKLVAQSSKEDNIDSAVQKEKADKKDEIKPKAEDTEEAQASEEDYVVEDVQKADEKDTTKPKAEDIQKIGSDKQGDISKDVQKEDKEKKEEDKPKEKSSFLDALGIQKPSYEDNRYKLPLLGDKLAYLNKELDNKPKQKGLYYNKLGYFVNIPSYFNINDSDAKLISCFYKKDLSHAVQLLIGIGKENIGIENKGNNINKLLNTIKARYEKLSPIKWDKAQKLSKKALDAKKAKEGISIKGESSNGLYYNLYYIYLLRDIRNSVSFFISILSFDNKLEDRSLVVDAEVDKVLKIYSSFHFF